MVEARKEARKQAMQGDGPTDVRGQMLARVVANPADLAARSQLWWDGAHLRHRKAARVRAYVRVGGGAAAVACLVTIALSRPRPQNIAMPEPSRTSPAPPAIRPADEVDEPQVQATSAQAVIRRLAAKPKQQSIVIDKGGARFKVAHRPDRMFYVHAGVVTVEDVGTVFLVERRGEDAWVQVDEGAVNVTWPGGHRPLQAGQSGLFPPRLPTPPRSASPAPAGRIEAKTSMPDWQGLMRRGNYADAWSALLHTPAARLQSDPEALFLAADLARKLNHPDAALGYLQLITRHHRGDVRVALASFTMARIYLDDMDKPHAAARAFAAAGSLKSAPGALLEDALAGEALAWQRAGQSEAARSKAAQYISRYPGGRFVERLRPLGR